MVEQVEEKKTTAIRVSREVQTKLKLLADGKTMDAFLRTLPSTVSVPKELVAIGELLDSLNAQLKMVAASIKILLDDIEGLTKAHNTLNENFFKFTLIAGAESKGIKAVLTNLAGPEVLGWIQEKMTEAATEADKIIKKNREEQNDGK